MGMCIYVTPEAQTPVCPDVQWCGGAWRHDARLVLVSRRPELQEYGFMVVQT